MNLLSIGTTAAGYSDNQQELLVMMQGSWTWKEYSALVLQLEDVKEEWVGLTWQGTKN